MQSAWGYSQKYYYYYYYFYCYFYSYYHFFFFYYCYYYCYYYYVSWLPVLDCGMTFHPGFGGWDSPILLDDL